MGLAATTGPSALSPPSRGARQREAVLPRPPTAQPNREGDRPVDDVRAPVGLPGPGRVCPAVTGRRRGCGLQVLGEFGCSDAIIATSDSEPSTLVEGTLGPSRKGFPQGALSLRSAAPDRAAATTPLSGLGHPPLPIESAPGRSDRAGSWNGKRSIVELLEGTPSRDDVPVRQRGG